MKKEIKICKCGCERCNHEWISRKKEAPMVCPKCKSPYWNKKKNLKGGDKK